MRRRRSSKTHRWLDRQSSARSHARLRALAKSLPFCSATLALRGDCMSYRRLAFDTYAPICADCGFGIPEVLEVAHLDGNRRHNDLENLAILCPNCHKMHDLDLISTETIVEMRDREKAVDWSKRMKDAGRKAANTRKKRAQALKRKWRAAGKKAAETKRRNRGRQ